MTQSPDAVWNEAKSKQKKPRDIFDCGDCIVAIDGCYDECARAKSKRKEQPR